MTRPPIVVVIPKRSAPEPARPHAAEHHEFTPKGKPNPLTVAQFWLGERLEERNGAFYLDGRPARLDQVMQAANRVLKSNGQDQVGVNPRWTV